MALVLPTLLNMPVRHAAIQLGMQTTCLIAPSFLDTRESYIKQAAFFIVTILGPWSLEHDFNTKEIIITHYSKSEDTLYENLAITNRLTIHANMQALLQNPSARCS